MKCTKNTINEFGSKTGNYPAKLKITRIIQETKKNMLNYRPIGMLNCVNTVIEKLLLTRINSF